MKNDYEIAAERERREREERARRERAEGNGFSSGGRQEQSFREGPFWTSEMTAPGRARERGRSPLSRSELCERSEAAGTGAQPKPQPQSAFFGYNPKAEGRTGNNGGAKPPAIPAPPKNSAVDTQNIGPMGYNTTVAGPTSQPQSAFFGYNPKAEGRVGRTADYGVTAEGKKVYWTDRAGTGAQPKPQPQSAFFGYNPKADGLLWDEENNIALDMTEEAFGAAMDGAELDITYAIYDTNGGLVKQNATGREAELARWDGKHKVVQTVTVAGQPEVKPQSAYMGYNPAAEGFNSGIPTDYGVTAGGEKVYWTDVTGAGNPKEYVIENGEKVYWTDRAGAEPEVKPQSAFFGYNPVAEGFKSGVADYGVSPLTVSGPLENVVALPEGFDEWDDLAKMISPWLLKLTEGAWNRLSDVEKFQILSPWVQGAEYELSPEGRRIVDDVFEKCERVAKSPYPWTVSSVLFDTINEYWGSGLMDGKSEFEMARDISQVMDTVTGINTNQNNVWASDGTGVQSVMGWRDGYDRMGDVMGFGLQTDVVEFEGEKGKTYELRGWSGEYGSMFGGEFGIYVQDAEEKGWSRVGDDRFQIELAMYDRQGNELFAFTPEEAKYWQYAAMAPEDMATFITVFDGKSEEEARAIVDKLHAGDIVVKGMLVGNNKDDETLLKTMAQAIDAHNRQAETYSWANPLWEWQEEQQAQRAIKTLGSGTDGDGNPYLEISFNAPWGYQW